ncbi:PAAR domain-containing protein [Rahnella sp. C60]|uniref:PAAR domain-containing protein n=1 Tax=Rahnella perminowiae TaxID=2816244 RepID=UPI001C2813D5|nr:PAAR domain-containing protein [Rahnella perminowiae]MBU9809549.1 PAAR domain-containing protein [Rahnella perminowiae]MBU9816608.1 PAAR domain-containing protein [Rahnella perminowiae]
MQKGIIRLGDKLTSGGVVMSASSTMIIEGIVAALIGDVVICPLLGHGVNRIVSTTPTWLSDGKQVAFDQAVCACGCKVLSSLPTTYIEG